MKNQPLSKTPVFDSVSKCEGLRFVKVRILKSSQGKLPSSGLSEYVDSGKEQWRSRTFQARIKNRNRALEEQGWSRDLTKETNHPGLMWRGSGRSGGIS